MGIIDFDKYNKVYLVGTILSNPMFRKDEVANENVVYFTLAVERKGRLYGEGFNFDKYNYFYCCMLERNYTLSVLRQKFTTLDKMQRVEIKGLLDNRVGDKVVAESRTRQINYRTLNAFVSTVNVLDINKVKDTRSQDEIRAEKTLLLRIRQTFGSDASISIDKNAYNKDYFGFDKNDDLPDY